MGHTSFRGRNLEVKTVHSEMGRTAFVARAWGEIDNIVTKAFQRKVQENGIGIDGMAHTIFVAGASGTKPSNGKRRHWSGSN